MKRITIISVVIPSLLLVLFPACSKNETNNSSETNNPVDEVVEEIIEQDISSQEVFNAITSWGSSCDDVSFPDFG